MKNKIFQPISFIYVFAISCLLSMCFTTQSHAQQRQNISGTIIDKDSKYPIIGANVVLVGSDPLIGAVTDINGTFSLENIPIGRLALQVSAIGYENAAQSNLVLVSGKELIVNFELSESLTTLEEVVVKGSVEKVQVNNELAVVSSRSFNTEETGRYAGSRNDPARMSANFAGVSGANDSRNDIIVRGNTPSGLLWRLEGIDIPSPNHFASFGSTGGPVGMLNNNTLAKSDFITAAFPANYGNALSGVFDLSMRKGNANKREYTGQVGFNGVEIGAEGPFSKNSRATYLINYRYSTLGLFKALGADFGTGTAVPFYQDVSFKVDIPTESAGTFKIFGLGGVSSIDLLGSEADIDNTNESELFGNENQDIYNRSRTGIVGLSHTYFFNKNTSYRLTLAGTHQLVDTEIDSVSIVDRSVLTRHISINNTQNRYIAHLFFNTKLNAKNTLSFGSISTIYNSVLGDSILTSDGWRNVAESAGNSFLTQVYGTWQHKFDTKLTLNLGLHFQNFGLNNSNGLGPRVGLLYQPNANSSFSFGYGLHHQLQLLPVYFAQELQDDGSFLSTNEDLGFTASHHFALTYDYQFSPDFRLKVEGYYQYLYNVPISNQLRTYSVLNIGADFNDDYEDNLVNEGAGRNYGIEFTLEKFYSKQYYFLLTASLFQAKYRASDNVWRNTAFNGNYVVNFLGGKTFTIGKTNELSIDWKATFAGGRYYTARESTETLADRYSGYFRTDLKIFFRMNLAKTTHEWGIDIQNVTNRKNVFREVFNERTGEVNNEYQLGIFPVPQYRIFF